jgi:hypothetical protein
VYKAELEKLSVAADLSIKQRLGVARFCSIREDNGGQRGAKEQTVRFPGLRFSAASGIGSTWTT